MGGTGLTFNFGVAGGGPVQSFFTLERLVRLHRKPDQLVVEAWWFQAARDNANFALVFAAERRRAEAISAMVGESGRADRLAAEDCSFVRIYGLARALPVPEMGPGVCQGERAG